MTKGSDNGNEKKAEDKKKGFSPVNDLEKKLARIRSGRTTFLKAFNFLMNSMVVVLMKPAKEEGGEDKRLVVRSPEGKPLVAIFSSAERASGTLAHHRSYTAVVKMPGWQVISALPDNRGLVVNPGWPVGFTVMPEELQKLRKKFRLESRR
jgi:hypothetical protein